MNEIEVLKAGTIQVTLAEDGTATLTLDGNRIERVSHVKIVATWQRGDEWKPEVEFTRLPPLVEKSR